jgi:hypothetical protein
MAGDGNNVPILFSKSQAENDPECFFCTALTVDSGLARIGDRQFEFAVLRGRAHLDRSFSRAVGHRIAKSRLENSCAMRPPSQSIARVRSNVVSIFLAGEPVRSSAITWFRTGCND